MEVLIILFSGLMQLAIVGLIVWACVRAVGRHRRKTTDADQPLSVRRLFVYGLLFTTLMLTAIGAVRVLQELARSVEDDRSALAFGLALVIVAGPAYGLLLRYATRCLRERASEGRSFSWAAYLNLSLLVSLIVSTVAAQRLIEGVTGVADFEVAFVVPVVVWGTVWAVHWFWLRAVYGLPGDSHLAAGSLTGLVTLAIGFGGLAFLAGDEIYTRIVERVPVGHYEPEFRSWAIATSIGALVWSWHWLGRYQQADRTPLWHAYVVLIGALGGLVAAVASTATVGYWTLVWFLGDPNETSSSRHFENVPAAAAVLIVGAAAWQYHRVVLQRRHDVDRTEPLRTYDYLMAASGMVSVVVGVTLALVALFEAVTPEPVRGASEVANRLILGVTLMAIGVPLWSIFWSRIRCYATTSPVGELGSAVRRIHLIALFGVGAIIVLISLINVLFLAFEDLLNGSFGGETVRSFRVGLSLVITVTGMAGYHLGVFRSDRELLTKALPDPGEAPARRLMLIAPPGTTLAAQLATVTGANVESCYRTDDVAMPAIDLDELAAEIDASHAAQILVLIGHDGPIVVPYES